jgi:hypothetical protein
MKMIAFTLFNYFESFNVHSLVILTKSATVKFSALKLPSIPKPSSNSLTDSLF